LLTDMAESEIEQLRQDRLKPSLASRSPKKWKEILSSEIVKVYRGERAAKSAEEEFGRVFGGHEFPSEIEEIEVGEKKINIVDLLVKTRLASSKSEARRLVEQGGVKVDGNIAEDREGNITVKDGMVVQVGRRRFIKLKIKD